MKRIIFFIIVLLFLQPVFADDEPDAGERKVITIDDVEYVFHWCPAGTFTMGSPLGEKGRYDRETPHQVTLSEGFWMAEMETTQEQWQTVMGDNPSYFKGDNLLEEGSDPPVQEVGDKRPVEKVSWNDCQEFVNKLNGLGVAPAGYKFALPTEAQWEYACRAGTTTPFNFGSALNGDKANCNGNNPYGTNTTGDNLQKTTDVGSYSANAWGLFDMHGNVAEWCNDLCGDYPTGNVTDPTGAASGSSRVLRGGGWHHFADAKDCRSANRHYFVPSNRLYDLGLRVAIVIDNRKVIKIKGVEHVFRRCPAGVFTMGSPSSEKGRNDRETPHQVTLSNDFWMAETEMTQEQWHSVMGDNPSYFKGNKLPVKSVSWDDCQKCMDKLNELKVAPAGYIFALPTEAQWEYACRAGSTTAYCFGDDGEQLEEYAWFSGHKDYEEWKASKEFKNNIFSKWGKTTHKVGMKNANTWGLFDMHGNVAEWCNDLYGDYTTGNVTDPTGAANGSSRVLRGGGWSDSAERCRSAIRASDIPSSRSIFLGLRVALVKR